MSAQSKGKQDDEFLRRMFDAIYLGIDRLAKVPWRDLPYRLRESWLDINDSVRRIIKIEVLLLFLTVVLALGALTALRAWQAANRPTVVQRLASPVALEARLAPVLPLSFPAQVAEMTLSAEPATSEPLGNCLMSLTQALQSCGLSQTATWVEQAAYMLADSSAGVTLTAAYVGEQAPQTLFELYVYARQIGRVGNFALMDSLPVTHMTSTYQDVWNFSWTHEGWLYSVSAPSYERVMAFVNAFPY